MNRNYSFFNERSFKARVFELSLHPVEFKARGMGAIRRTPKPAPYNPDARDGDNDGLRQEGTIWERPAGTVFLDIIKGARRMTRGMSIVDGDGNRVDYTPGDNPNSPLRGGGHERRIRGRGDRRLARANRRRARAGRQRARAEEQRPEIEALDEKIGRLEAAVAEDSKERLLEAERGDDRAAVSSFLEGFVEGFTGVKQNWAMHNREERTEKERNALQEALRLEGARRQAGDAAGNDPIVQREMEFDDQILPPGIDRDEHRRLLDEDPEYRRHWNDRLAGMELGMDDDGDLFIPIDADGNPDIGLEEFPDAPEADVPEVDADEVRDVQELIEAVGEQDAGSLPDDRSRRNVRNRFPERGLPEEAFWRNDDYEPREGRDRDAEITEHDRRFGRYYDDDGNLNDRGRLVNEQLREEREEADVPETPESQGGGAPDPDADIPEDDGPNARLQRRLDDQAFAIEDSLVDEASNENELAEIEFAIDELDREATDAFNAGAIEQEDLDRYAERMRSVRGNIEEARRNREERDAEIDADIDAGEDRGRAVDPPEAGFGEIPQRDFARGFGERRREEARRQAELDEMLREEFGLDDAPEDIEVEIPGEDVDVPEVGRPEEGWHLYADLSDEELDKRLDEQDPDDLDFLLREERRRGDLVRNDNELAELRNDLQARGWVNRDREVAEEQERRALINEVLPELPEDAPDPDLPDLGEADNDPPWPARRYADMEDREVEQRIDRIIAADPEGFRGFRLDERDALIEERRRRRDAGVWDGDPIVVDQFAPDPDVPETPESQGGGAPAEDLLPPPAPVNLNGATATELGRMVREGSVDEKRQARLEIDRRRGESQLADVERMNPEDLDEELRAILIQRPADLVGPLDDDPRMRELFQERDRRIAAASANDPNSAFLASDRERIRNLDEDELLEEIQYNRDNNNQDELLNGLAERDQRRAAAGEGMPPADLDGEDRDWPLPDLPEERPEDRLDIEDAFREDFDAVDAMEVGDEAGERRRAAERLVNRIMVERRDNRQARRDDPDLARLSDNALRAAVEMANDERNISAIRNLRDGDGRLIRDLDQRVADVYLVRQAAVRGQLTPEMLDEAIEALRRWEGIDAPAGNRGRLTRRLRVERRGLMEIRDWPDPDNPDLLNMPNMDEDEFQAFVVGRIEAQDRLRRAMMRHDADPGELPGQLEELRRINAEMPLLHEEADRRKPRGRPHGGLQATIQESGRLALQDIVRKADTPREGVPGRTIEPFNEIPQRDFADDEYEDAVRGVVSMMDNVKKKIRRVQHGRRGRGNDENKGVPAVAGHRANVDRALADMDRRWQAAPRGSDERRELGKVRTKLRNLQGRLDKERDIRQGHEDARIAREERIRVENVDHIRVMREWDNRVDMDALRDRMDNDLDDDALINDLDAHLHNDDRRAMQAVRLDLINDADERVEVEGIQARANANRDEIKRIKTQVENRAAIRQNRDWVAGKEARVGELRDIIANNPDGSPSIDREIIDLEQEIRDLPDLPQGSLRTRRREMRNQLKELKNQVGERDAQRRVKEFMDDDVRFGELNNKIDAGQIVEVDIDADIAEIDAILEEIQNLPRIRHNTGLNNRRREHRQQVEDLRERFKVARRDMVLGPMADPVPWEGDMMDADRMANPAQGVRPRPDGLGIAGRRGSNGTFQIEKVAVGNQGMGTQMQADRYVRGGGNISDVPDDFLAKALLENASSTEGERFLITVENGGAIGTTYVLNQRLADGTYGKHGFLIKAHSSARDVEGMNELVGAELGHQLGLPMLPGRGNGKIATRGGGQGTAVVLEHALNGLPGAEEMTIGGNRRNFDLDMVDGTAALGPRMDNFMVNWLLGVEDRHANNGLMGHNPDGEVGVIPIDLAWNFQASQRDPSRYGFGMDNGLIRQLQAESRLNPDRRDAFAQQIRTTLERFNAIISDPNEKERLFKGGAFRDIFSTADVDQKWRQLNRHLETLTGSRPVGQDHGLIDIDYIIGKMLG